MLSIDVSPRDYINVRELSQALKELDKDAQKEIKSGIKSTVSVVAREMQDDIRTSVDGAPMSGMLYGGTRNRWLSPSVKASLRLSAGPGKPIATIYGVGPRGYARMFAITELAGSRSPGYTQDGQRMVQVLKDRFPLVKGRGGRFIFKSFLKYRTGMHDRVEAGLDKLAQAVNMRLQRGK